MIDLVLLDFDGTLVDTAPDLIRATNIYLRSVGVEPISEAIIRAEIGMGLRKLILDVYPEKNLTAPEQKKIYDDFVATYEQEYLRSPQLFPEAMEFLVEFEGEISIVSNKRERFIRPILQKVGLIDFPFRKIIGGDTLKHMKPHPEPFLQAIQASDTTPERTLVVGDGAPDVVGALNVGAHSAVVEFGYAPVEDLIALGAQYRLSSFGDLRPLLASIT
jgi:phosphoglycolate phosphatase